MTLEEFVHIFSEVTNLPARYVTLPAGQPDIPLPEGLKEELDDNWAMFNEFGYEIHDDPDVIHPNQVCRSVYDRVGTFANVATVGSKSKARYRSRLDPKARLELLYKFVRGRRRRLEIRASSGAMDLIADASDIFHLNPYFFTVSNLRVLHINTHNPPSSNARIRQWEAQSTTINHIHAIVICLHTS
jgi:hypothetical protein